MILFLINFSSGWLIVWIKAKVHVELGFRAPGVSISTWKKIIFERQESNSEKLLTNKLVFGPVLFYTHVTGYPHGYPHGYPQ